MNKIILPAFLIFFPFILSAQEVQKLNPARIGIFKNGTCFVKREGIVNVMEKSFYINAPEKVLMGSYWVMVGKESSLHSVIVKTDNFKVKRAALYLKEFLEANIGQEITLYGNAVNTDLRKLSGRLLNYDKKSSLVTIASPAGKVVVTDASSLTWFESSVNPNSTLSADSIIAVAKVLLNKQVAQITASTISLETGVKWYPSYLFTTINDKEAKLEMKATIVNGETEYLNLPVDIIIGSPEMFYGEMIDPACITYLTESLLENRYDNNGLYNMQILNSNSSSAWQGINRGLTKPPIDNYDDPEQQKEGQKNEDLYYYQLGVLDLEKNSKVIVPVMTTNINYFEIYTADLPENSPSLKGEHSVQVYNNYVITNNNAAPLTAGAVFILNKGGQPMAQTRLFYTPSGGSTEINLSKAVDIQVKNDEEIKSREKTSTLLYGERYYIRINTSGKISIRNYKDKKIKIRVTKDINGFYESADNNGKNNKTDDKSRIFWEVEVAAGGKIELGYKYYTLE